MKKVFSFILIAAAVCLAASCQKEKDKPGNDDVVSGNTVVFTATSEGASSKTTIEDGTGNNCIVKWAAGDVIDILWDGGSATSSASSAGTTTRFEAEVDPASAYFAVYPSGAGSLDGSVLSITVPSQQDGTFAASNIAVATTDAVSHNFTFYNATALVKFSVSDAAYTKAVFKGARAEDVAGTAPVTFSSGNISTGAVFAGEKSVEVTLGGAGEYYFAVLPQTFEEGFSITLYKGASADAPAFVRNSRELARATVLDMGAVDAVAAVTDFFVTPSGAGKKSGKSWDNAMGAAQLKTLIQQPMDGSSQNNDAAYYKAQILDGVTIHMAGGDYDLGGNTKIEFNGYGKQVAISFKGGYPAGLAGSSLAGRDTTTIRTAFTGASAPGSIITLGNQTDITFEGITFKDASRDANGGALYVAAGSSGNCTLRLVGCRFLNNSNSTGYTGAGLYLGKSTATVSYCYFGGNSARNGSAINMTSGAGDISIDHCSFKCNHSSNTSGAVQNGGRTAEISDCLFEGNQADDFGGGAFHTNGSGAVTSFSGCIFKSNSAPRGGAVSVQNGTATFTDCEFKDNTASYVDASTTVKPEGGNAGGAIIMRDANASVTIDNCAFLGNSATAGTGGAIAINQATSLTIGNGTSFGQNTAKYHGGAISLTSGQLTISDASFSKNAADGRGGVFYVASGSAGRLAVSNSVFSENECKINGDWGGGVLSTGQDANSCDALFDNCVFSKNHSLKQGGVIAIQSYAFLKMNNCLFKENYSGSRGACLRLNNNTIAYLNAVTFRNNYTKEGTSWGLCVHGGTSNVVCANNVTAVGNYAENASAASVVSFNSDGRWLFTNSTVVDAANTALVRGANSGSRIVLCNNILINTGDASKMFVLNGSGSFVSNGSNVLSCSSDPASPISLASSDLKGVTALGNGSYFENLAADGSLDKAGYSWNGTLSGFAATSRTVVENTMKNDFAVTASARSSISNIGLDFYNWLSSIGALGTDGRNYVRSGSWWPGAYQGSASAPQFTASCPKAVIGTVMKGETVTVSVGNISSSTRVTVNFNSESASTITGPGEVSYAFESSGDKTITVKYSPDSGYSKSFNLHVENLESIQRVAQRLKDNPMLCLVMAHRANSSDWSIPENSLAGIQKCINDKIDFIETDLWTTSDGVLVVSHDETLNRETNGSGKISAKTLSQIKSLYLRDRNGNVTNQRMLTFDELLDACKGKIYVNVDIGDRDASIPDVINAVRNKGMSEQVIIYCNTADKIESAFSADPLCNVYCFVSNASTQKSHAVAGRYYFAQCGWNPTIPEASANGQVDPDKQPTSASVVRNALDLGVILTVNAIYSSNTEQLYPTTFPLEQMNNILSVFPECQCLQVDTGAETRAAVLAAGRSLLQP